MSIRKSAREEAERTGLFLGDWHQARDLQPRVIKTTGAKRQ